MSLLNEIMPHVPPIVQEIDKSWEEVLAEKEAKWWKKIERYQKRQVKKQGLGQASEKGV